MKLKLIVEIGMCTTCKSSEKHAFDNLDNYLVVVLEYLKIGTFTLSQYIHKTFNVSNSYKTI